MPERVAILEDDPSRIAAMRMSLADEMPGVEVVLFEVAQEMIAWLVLRPQGCRLASQPGLSLR